jgi:hypothetical protein
VVAPLFSADHKLVFPEGTRLIGTVAVAKKARSFHRGGQLRFNFQRVDLPPEVANLRPAAPRPEPMKTQAILAGAEGNGTAPIKVDSEGGVEAKESKTRFIAPVISLILASRAADNGHHHDADDTGGNTGEKPMSPAGRWEADWDSECWVRRCRRVPSRTAIKRPASNYCHGGHGTTLSGRQSILEISHTSISERWTL